MTQWMHTMAHEAADCDKSDAFMCALRHYFLANTCELLLILIRLDRCLLYLVFGHPLPVLLTSCDWPLARTETCFLYWFVVLVSWLLLLTLACLIPPSSAACPDSSLTFNDAPVRLLITVSLGSYTSPSLLTLIANLGWGVVRVILLGILVSVLCRFDRMINIADTHCLFTVIRTMN